jgi:hypothetical protein
MPQKRSHGLVSQVVDLELEVLDGEAVGSGRANLEAAGVDPGSLFTEPGLVFRCIIAAVGPAQESLGYAGFQIVGGVNFRQKPFPLSHFLNSSSLATLRIISEARSAVNSFLRIASVVRYASVLSTVIRIISARKAKKHEIRRYQEEEVD